MIDWTNFTPVSALIGGVMIGIAAAAFALLTGRIAGVSGILGGLLRPAPGDIAWRAAFIGGLIVAPWAYSALSRLPESTIEASYPVVVIAGLLVGIGTRYGAGCTSGHGVCGIARLSRRSLVATGCFMAAGFATVFVVRQALS
jgi:uncharacterized membrane protein YedE/YeeE